MACNKALCVMKHCV